MSRPHHSFEGFRGLLLMSAAAVFVLVEGREVDQFFYNEICAPLCTEAGLPFEIYPSDIFSERGGKAELLALFRYLLEMRSLASRNGGRSYFCVFFMDKDVDDVLRDMIDSPHIVYTPTYNVENEVFRWGDIATGAAAASSLSRAQLARSVSHSSDWRKRKADLWKEFVILCLFSEKHSLACDCGYRRMTSPLNDPADAPCQSAAVQSRKATLLATSGLEPQHFERKFRAVARLVDCKYRNGQHDAVFNGKWYVEHLSRDIEVAAAGRRYPKHALKNSVRAAVVATVDFNGAWTQHFREPLRKLIAAQTSQA